MSEFELHAARAFFACAWADQCEESDNADMMSGREIMGIMPGTLDPAALHAARTLRMGVERANGKPVADIRADIESIADGDRLPTMEFFGHYAAMQSMGHGVGLYDAFGKAACDAVKIPYVEFGGHSLEKDYF